MDSRLKVLNDTDIEIDGHQYRHVFRIELRAHSHLEPEVVLSLGENKGLKRSVYIFPDAEKLFELCSDQLKDSGIELARSETELLPGLGA